MTQDLFSEEYSVPRIHYWQEKYNIFIDLKSVYMYSVYIFQH